MLMICTICGEDDKSNFFLGKCRRCLSMPLQNLEFDSIEFRNTEMPFSLTDEQKKISNALISIYEKEHVFIDAVCGAGKTEICIEMIMDAFKKGKRIAWAIPRREVVLELGARLSKYFEDYTVRCVCEGYTSEFTADLIVCTTHQLYRYKECFDVLILDEPDAFPYAGNRYLENIAKASCKGTIIYLSATFYVPNVTRLILSSRPSKIPLPEPIIKSTRFPLVCLLGLLRNVKDEHCIIFVPTINIAKRLSRILKIPYITSKTLDKQTVLDNFRSTKGKLIATTVLERGVTFIDCYVIVFMAHHKVFTESSLVQISGRAMRGMNPKKGKVWFICQELSQAIVQCTKRISKANTDAAYVLSQKIKGTDS